MDTELLDLREKRVTVAYVEAGEKKRRSFLLREHTISEQERYIRLFTQPWDALVKLNVEIQDAAEQRGEPVAAEAVEGSLKAVMEQQTELITWLLSNPTDGVSAPSLDWVQEHVNWRQRNRIIEIQDELNGAEEMEKNAAALREAALSRRLTRDVTKELAGGKLSTSSLPVTPLHPQA